MAGTLPETIRMRKRMMGFATQERRWQAGPLKKLVLEAIDSPHLRPYVRKAGSPRVGNAPECRAPTC